MNAEFFQLNPDKSLRRIAIDRRILNRIAVAAWIIFLFL